RSDARRSRAQRATPHALQRTVRRNNTMKILNAATVALAALIAVPGLALAQGASPMLKPNPNIIIDYVEPFDPARLDYDPDDPKLTQGDRDKLRKMFANYEALKAVRERLMKAHLLERYALFLSAVRLPTTFRLRTKQCDQQNAFYDRTDSSLTLCYEY